MMHSNTSLIILTIFSSLFFANNTFAQSSYNSVKNQEKNCRSSVQGRVAWNREGNKSWQTSNLNKLCNGTSDARATVNCFKAQIRNHNDWNRGINACKANTNARLAGARQGGCTRKDGCYRSPVVRKGAIKDFGPFLTIDDVKYGYHCGDGRNSDKKPLDAVDAACQFHDRIHGGDRPFNNGLTLREFCSRQVRFVAKLLQINSSRLTSDGRRAKSVILEQFPTTLVPVGCAAGSAGETAVVATKKWGETAVKDTGKWGKTAVKDTEKFGETALNTLGLLGTAANEWRVEIDSCHKNLDNEGTKNTITVEFWSQNKKVKSKSRKGVKANCILNREFWSIRSNYTITHVIAKTNGTDGFYIDEVELFKGGKSKKRHGRDNGSGWCLSKDPKDGAGGWKGRVSNNRCVSQKQFNY